MKWDADVTKWAKNNRREPGKVKGLLVRSGWAPDQYVASMQQYLFYWLDQWYTLSVKNMPQPATTVRSNPIDSTHYVVITMPFVSGYATYKFNCITGDKEDVEYSGTFEDAMWHHDSI